MFEPQTLNMNSRPDGPGKTDKIMVWRDGAAIPIDARWGLRPLNAGEKPISLLRSERWEVTNPCLIVANDFGLRIDGKLRYRASLITTQKFFCIAGIWRPATTDWPLSFAALTVPAYPDIAPYKDRHVAVIRPEEWQDWLTGGRPAQDLLRPFPKGSFDVVGIGTPVAPPAKRAAVRDLFDL